MVSFLKRAFMVALVGCMMIFALALVLVIVFPEDKDDDDVLVAVPTSTGRASPAAAPSASAVPEPTSTPGPAYKLALISAACGPSATGDYTQCTGFVQNISGDELDDRIQVVIEWLDAGGVPRSSDTGYLEYSPLLADQQSPWSTFDTRNPDLTDFRVQFKESFGGTIATRDDR